MSYDDVLDVLQATSRTFFLPVTRLPRGLQEAVASAYLCMRALDEIEDHPDLAPGEKAAVLREVSRHLQAQTSLPTFDAASLRELLGTYQGKLPAVSLRLADWAVQAPPGIAPRIWEGTAAMADRMADWAERGWSILTPADLDRYTFSVAGSVGILLCDLLAFFEGVQVDRSMAVLFGRGLQLVNILRNRAEDVARGADFYPPGWGFDQVAAYARECLTAAEDYAMTVTSRAFRAMYTIPLKLALATLDALRRGEAKLSRAAVLALVQQLDGES
ncbi:MAG TPA: squalene/phytoene synthase family protein [Anaerolineales bacterium]|nr:squalene/phytoene synthase family protein [Anaerolineales bacterium]